MRQNLKAIFSGALVSLLLPAAGYAASPDVVVSIKPLHALVSAVMDGVGEPELIVKGASSPHTYNMKPSDAAAIAGATVIFWGGKPLEHFLEAPLQSLGSNAETVALIDAPGVHRLKTRAGGAFEPDRDGDQEHPGAEDVDPHFWLDPENAKAAVQTIAATLEKADPGNAARYAANAAKTENDLTDLEKTIAAELEPVKGKPFIVFHDAYHYFENRFGVAAAGSITVSPDVQPGAARVAEMEAKVRSLGAVCIFSEPQFEPRLVDTIANAVQAHKGVLDPIGSDLPAGPGLYKTLLLNLAGNLKSCLLTE